MEKIIVSASCLWASLLNLVRSSANCLPGGTPWRDALVASAAPRLTIYPAPPGTTSVPLRPSEGPACQVRRTTLDHLSRFAGHDKRAPPTLGGTCLPGPPNNVGSSIPLRRARQACLSDPRRDLLVRSAEQRWIIYPAPPGTTSVPLRPSEGPACQVRRTTLDHLSRSAGHDKRASPTLGGTCLSGPPNNVGSSIPLRRARQACPSDRPLRHAGLPILLLQT
jgi:hypothetical protein